jgi:putative methyltransferase (TIGR04325 family)
MGRMKRWRSMSSVPWMDRIAALPGLRHWRTLRYERAFRANRERNMFRGVFDSYEAAQRSAPNNRSLGYDNAESAAMYFGHMAPDPYDYPAMFWLDRSIAAGSRRIFDVGGHIGIKYYAFKTLLDLPADLTWTVCDVPTVVARGASAAVKRDPSKQLSFTSDYAQVASCDLLFASGVVQYLPMTMFEWLSPRIQRPARIILNTTAIHPTKSFFTLNSIGTAYCPYRVTSEPEFVKQMTDLGYRKVDQWRTPGKGALILPTQSGYDIAEYSGYVFDRK